MKLAIKQTILIEHLNYVIRGISSKNLIPILNCIKFELTTEGLYLISTDNDIAIKTFIPTKNIEKIIECGEMVISGRYIYEIIRKLPNEIINIEEVIDSKVYIYTSNSAFTLNCNEISDFPNIDLGNSKKPIIINSKIFKTIINQTGFVTSNQEARPVLTGINFKIFGNKLECTATDSYRLAKKSIELKEAIEENIDIIVPTKNLNELIRVLSTDEENLELHIFNNKIIFKYDTLIIMSKLINGTFPDTSRLIPTTFLLTMKIKLNYLLASIDRASLLTSEADKNTIKLESKKNIITISSNIPEIGNVEEKLEVLKSNNEEIKIAFSSKYMIDALKSLESEEVELLFNGDIKPIIIKNPETDNLIQLVLPIRTY